MTVKEYREKYKDQWLDPEKLSGEAEREFKELTSGLSIGFIPRLPKNSEKTVKGKETPKSGHEED